MIDFESAVRRASVNAGAERSRTAQERSVRHAFAELLGCARGSELRTASAGQVQSSCRAVGIKGAVAALMLSGIAAIAAGSFVINAASDQE